MRVKFTRLARLDLIEIGDYLAAAAGKPVASRWVERLEAKALKLARNPFMGAQDERLGQGRRRLILRPYIIIYRVSSPDLVRIIRIVHGARNLPDLVFDED